MRYRAQADLLEGRIAGLYGGPPVAADRIRVDNPIAALRAVAIKEDMQHAAGTAVLPYLGILLATKQGWFAQQIA